ncbi:MAG: glutathione S-transferase [Deltaproteobacteria bacterium]|nr:glutathione S-transferase [Deltaproteobacteria bacterium]
MNYPILWHFPISHFNEKVRWALDFKRVPHLRRALGPSYLFKAWWATGRATLPVLILDGKAIGDSSRIIAALEQRHPNPPLYPDDEAARARALALEDFFDEEVGPALRTAIVGQALATEPDVAQAVLTTGMGESAQRAIRLAFPLFHPFYRLRHKISSASMAAAPAKIQAGMDRIVAELQPSGYLAGDSFTVADLTAAAIMSPMVLPPELEYAPPPPLPQILVDYRNRFAGHPAFQWVLEMYRRHRGASAELRP